MLRAPCWSRCASRTSSSSTSSRSSSTPGFNVLTGETGAGKSIVVGALSLVLGGRASAEQVRPGADEAEVEALFDVRGSDRLVAQLDAARHGARGGAGHPPRGPAQRPLARLRQRQALHRGRAGGPRARARRRRLPARERGAHRSLDAHRLPRSLRPPRRPARRARRARDPPRGGGRQDPRSPATPRSAAASARRSSPTSSRPSTPSRRAPARWTSSASSGTACATPAACWR